MADSVISGLTELHLHLDGSLRWETLLSLAAEAGVEIPPRLGFYQGMGLAAALACFQTTLSVLQAPEAVKRVAGEICEDALRDGVTALEIRFAPQLHRAAPPEEIVDAAVDGVDRRAGLILCGLYGEPPTTLARLVEIARNRPAVVGIDLAGGPAPGQQWSLADYHAAFKRAKELGIGRTVHAGEGRPPQEIRAAIESLHAERIGHGTTLLDDPSVLELVLTRDVTIEACPTSNLHTGAIPALSAHPLVSWLQLGVKACVCADNTLLSATTTAEEVRRVRRLPGMTPELEALAHDHARSARFQR